MNSEMNTIEWAFFGTSNISVIILDELKAKGFVPSLVVTVEDKPKGRKMILSSPETKVWAEKNNVPFVQFASLKDLESEKIIKSYSPEGFDLFVVASYGKIIPQNILDIPKFGALNIHPSLLPKLRGASPIKSAILMENETGVTVMKLDNEMDHGPIVAQKKIEIEWPPYEDDLENLCGKVGADLLAEVIPNWIAGKIMAKEQDHSKATICKKIQKSDGEINLADEATMNLRKIRAFHTWPTAYFFTDSKKRVIVKHAHIENGQLILDSVLPEGKKEMSYKDFLNGEKSKKV